MSPFNKNVEKQATAAMRAAQNGIDAADVRARRQLTQSPPRSNSEALGRGFREFILPMIVQGAQTWKDNYDARGAFKDRAQELLGTIKAGGTLSEADRRIVDEYKARYPKEYEAALAAFQPAQPAQTPVSPGVSSQNLPQFKNPADAATIDPGTAFTGETLAQEANDNWLNALGNLGGNTDELKKLLAWR